MSKGMKDPAGGEYVWTIRDLFEIDKKIAAEIRAGNLGPSLEGDPIKMKFEDGQTRDVVPKYGAMVCFEAAEKLSQ